MKAINLILAASAALTVAVSSSQALAVRCYTPALTFFDDVIPASEVVRLTCNSRPTGGAVTTATATASESSDRIFVRLLEGTYARIGAYDVNRQGLGCAAEDRPPIDARSAFADCNGDVRFYDVEVRNE
jgi:hypothetical protein